MPFGRGNQFYKFPRNTGFFLSTRNPPVVQSELLSGYLDSQRPEVRMFLCAKCVMPSDLCGVDPFSGGLPPCPFHRCPSAGRGCC